MTSSLVVAALTLTIGCASEAARPAPAAPAAPVRVAEQRRAPDGDDELVKAVVAQHHRQKWDECRAGASTACRYLVAIAKKAGVEETDPTRAKAAFRVAVAAGMWGCRAGDYDLCVEAAAMQFRGDAGQVDLKSSRQLLELACDHRHQEACVELGIQLFADTGPGDRERAASLFEEACRRDYAPGCDALATLRLADPATVTEARRAAERGCTLGDARACALYGHCLHEGIGGARDAAGAVAAFTKACNGGDPRGCQMLATMQPAGK